MRRMGFFILKDEPGVQLCSVPPCTAWCSTEFFAGIGAGASGLRVWFIRDNDGVPSERFEILIVDGQEPFNGDWMHIGTYRTLSTRHVFVRRLSNV